MSKPVNPRTIWWTGIAIWFGSLTAYAKIAPVIDTTVIIVYVVVLLLVVWWPILLMHWYLWSKDKDG
jgi:hypothetical protein